MPTYSPKASEITRAWHVIDADGLVLGRMCTEAARVLRGKHKPIFTPFLDTGDFVVVINAAQVAVTGQKLAQKMYQRYSGYPGGRRAKPLADVLRTKPEFVIRQAVKGMMPDGPLARQQLTKLKIYPGPEHPHKAQEPAPLTVSSIAAN